MDVLDLDVTPVAERKSEPIPHLISRGARKTYSSGLRQLLQARRNVDAVTVDVIAFHYHVAQVDADAKFDASLGRQAEIRLSHMLLYLQGAADSFDDACKFRQEAITAASLRTTSECVIYRLSSPENLYEAIRRRTNSPRRPLSHIFCIWGSDPTAYSRVMD